MPADLALKSLFVILAILALSLVSLFMGGAPTGVVSAAGEVVPPAGFWVAFAVFFPAVSGIEAGLGMSGDLKDAACFPAARHAHGRGDRVRHLPGDSDLCPSAGHRAGSGVGNDPRLATVVAFVIALLGILLGDLNAIARSCRCSF